MKRFAKFVIVLLATALMSSSAVAAISFGDNFESYNAPDNNPIGGNWLWYLTGWNDWSTCTDYWFGFGAYPAPNSNDPYTASNIAVGSTGQALNVFSDYANQEVQASDKCAEVSVFQEMVVGDSDTGQYTFRFEVQANEVLGDGVRTNGFIKLLDPNDDYATVYYDTSDTTAGGVRQMSVNLGANEVGMILQFGFANISNDNKVSSRLYDNVTFAISNTGESDSNPEGIPIPFWAMVLMSGLLLYVGGSRLRSQRKL
jgi:hypothetical protein